AILPLACADRLRGAVVVDVCARADLIDALHAVRRERGRRGARAHDLRLEPVAAQRVQVFLQDPVDLADRAVLLAHVLTDVPGIEHDTAPLDARPTRRLRRQLRQAFGIGYADAAHADIGLDQDTERASGPRSGLGKPVEC